MKLKYINGLKGICCILVCVGHMVSVLLPSLYFGGRYESHTTWARLIYESPLNALFNSSSALMCFLLISGFLIPLKSFVKNERIRKVDFSISSLHADVFDWSSFRLDCYGIRYSL